MDISFDFSYNPIQIHQILLLTLKVVFTIGYSKIFPSSYFSIFFYHITFFIIWLCNFLLFIKTFFGEKDELMVNESQIYKILERNSENLLIFLPLNQKAINASFIEKAYQNTVQKTHILLLNSDHDIIEKKFVSYYNLDIFTEPPDILMKKMNSFKNVTLFILTNHESQQYEAVLAASIFRKFCDKCLICCKLVTKETLFLEWSEWNFAIATQSLRVNINELEIYFIMN